MEASKQIEDSYPELFPKDFGERLERLRELARLSWEEFAERLSADEVWHIIHLASSSPACRGRNSPSDSAPMMTMRWSGARVRFPPGGKCGTSFTWHRRFQEGSR